MLNSSRLISLVVLFLAMPTLYAASGSFVILSQEVSGIQGYSDGALGMVTSGSTTLSDGKIVVAVIEFPRGACPPGFCILDMVLAIQGFSADPGQNYLGSMLISCAAGGGSGFYLPNAASYSYDSGLGRATWVGPPTGLGGCLQPAPATPGFYPISIF